MIIQHNMPAMNTNRQLGISAKAGQKSTEKLSSGYRINRAGDDAAGLAISEKMRSQIRGLDRASANSQDGISLIQTAEGALNETQSILQRMRELAVQAANGTNTDSDRNEIQKEVNQLTSEINRIGNTTEFNTMKLLKGNTNKAEIGDVASDTLKEAVVGSVTGELSELTVDKGSKVGSSSTAKVVGNIGAATGKVDNIKASGTPGIAGAKSTTTVGGITFTAKEMGTTLDNTKVQFVVIDDTGTEGIASGKIGSVDGKDIGGADIITIGLKKETIDKIDNVQKLIETINTLEAGGATLALAAGTAGTDYASNIDITGTSIAKVKISDVADMTAPADAASGNPIPTLKTVGENVSGSFGGGKAETQGVYKLDFKEAFKEAGDIITIMGHKFTSFDNSTGSTANKDAGEFNLFNATPALMDEENQAKSLIDAMKAVDEINDAFDIGWDGTNNTISIKEKAGYGGKLSSMGTNVKVEGSGGEDDYLEFTTGNGANGLIFKISNATATTDSLDVKFVNGTTGKKNTIEIKLGANASENTAENIQQKIRELGVIQAEIKEDITDPTNTSKVEVDLSQVTVKAGGNWDKDMSGFAHVYNEWDTANGGVMERKGEYSFDLMSILGEGDEITVAGQKFVAKEGGVASNGEIDITSKDKATQASKIKETLLQNSVIKEKYNIETKGNKITLTEKEASGVDLKVTDVGIAATGIKGEYKVNLDEILKDGASIEIDGQKIDVSSKNQHVGYDKGTAIKEADSLKNQAAALADAINKNADMAYTAKTDEEGNLVLIQKEAKEDAPVISTTSSTKGTFDVTFQVGANTGQSMTIAIGDTRSVALGVSSDGSEKSIMPDNGVEAFYTENQVVTDGTTNDNVEYALDVTSYEKATAAIGVIDDALAAISAQRSQLGAYQNRLEHTIANLDNTSENLQASESRIRDVDMAKEMSEFSKNNILQQAAQSMLAQANQSTQGVLTLLR